MTAKEYAIFLLDNSPYTQEEIALCLNVDQTLVSKWKNGTRSMTAIQFVNLCSLFGVSMLDFVNGVKPGIFKIAFSAKGLEKEDIIAIGKFGKLLTNLNYMETIDSNESSGNTGK